MKRGSFHRGLQVLQQCHIAASSFARKTIISNSVQVQHCRKSQTNAHFCISIFGINDQKVSFRSKSITLYKFVNNFFVYSHSVFETGMTMLQFSTRWPCRWFYLVAHGTLLYPDITFMNTEVYPKLRGWHIYAYSWFIFFQHFFSTIFKLPDRSKEKICCI